MQTPKLSFHAKLKKVKEFIAYQRAQNSKIDENDNVVISVNLANDIQLFQPLSPDDQRELNPEIYEYIEQKAYEVPLSRHLSIEFHGREVEEQEQTQLAESIKNHYFFQIMDKNDDLRINLIKSIALATLGVLVLALYFFLSVLSQNALFLEVISVVGSFAVWEAADYSLIERNAIKKDILDLMQLAEAEVSFKTE